VVSAESMALTLPPTSFFDMALPSEPGYIPAAQDPAVISSPFYRKMLSMNMDPYADHSRNESMIEMIEEFAFFRSEQQE
jgi:hypothetical protein